MILQLIYLLTTLEISYAAHQTGHWYGSKVSPGVDGKCVVEEDITLAINATHYIFGSTKVLGVNGTTYAYNANVRQTKNCDEILNADSNPMWYVTNYVDHDQGKNVMILSHYHDAGLGCLPDVRTCNGPPADNITRYQLCRVGFPCEEVLPETGRLVSGYGWFEGDAAGNFEFSEANRTAAGIMTAITLGVLLFALLTFRALLTDKISASCQCLSKDALTWSLVFLGFVWWILIMISCGAPNWSEKFESEEKGSTLGLWLACPNGGTCVDSLAGTRADIASTGIVFARLVTMLSVFLAMPIFIIPFYTTKDPEFSKWIFATVVAALTVAAFQFTAMVAWASFHNDVLVPQSKSLGYEVDYGYSFGLCWMCLLMGLGIAVLLEMLELKNRGDRQSETATQNFSGVATSASAMDLETETADLGKETEGPLLPSGWVQMKNDDGVYYFHQATGKTSYEPPPRTTVPQ